MTALAKKRSLMVASQAEAESLVKGQPGFWQVISIREPFHPELQPRLVANRASFAWDPNDPYRGTPPAP